MVEIGLARRVFQSPVGERAVFIFNHSTKRELQTRPGLSYW